MVQFDIAGVVEGYRAGLTGGIREGQQQEKKDATSLFPIRCSQWLIRDFSGSVDLIFFIFQAAGFDQHVHGRSRYVGLGDFPFPGFETKSAVLLRNGLVNGLFPFQIAK